MKTEYPEVPRAFIGKMRSKISELLKSRLPTEEARMALAQRLNKSESTIHDLLYRQTGSADLIIAAIGDVFSLDEVSLDVIFSNLGSTLSEASEVQRRWQALPFDDRTRLQIISALEMAVASRR